MSFMRPIAALVLTALSVCAPASSDPFAERIRTGDFTAADKNLAESAADLVYGRANEKELDSKHLFMDTTLRFGQSCISQYIQPRFFFEDDKAVRYFSSGHYSFESEIGNQYGRACPNFSMFIASHRNEAQRWPEKAQGYNLPASEPRKWQTRESTPISIFVQILSKDAFFDPGHLRSFERYGEGYFGKSKFCELYHGKGPLGNPGAVILYRVDGDHGRSLTSKRLEFGGVSGFARPSVEDAKAADQLVADGRFVECYMRAHLVAMGLDGGAILPKDSVMDKRISGTASFCRVAASVPADTKFGYLCRVPSSTTRKAIGVYSRLQADFPTSRRIVQRSEFVFELLTRLDSRRKPLAKQN